MRTFRRRLLNVHPHFSLCSLPVHASSGHAKPAARRPKSCTSSWSSDRRSRGIQVLRCKVAPGDSAILMLSSRGMRRLGARRGSVRVVGGARGARCEGPLRAAAPRPARGRRAGDAGHGRRLDGRRAHPQDGAVADHARPRARPRQVQPGPRGERRDRRAAPDRLGEQGEPLVHRDGVLRHEDAVRDPAERPREPGVVHAVHAVPARGVAGAPRSR